MPRVVGIDHLVLSVGSFARSKEFYGKLLGFLGFKLKHDYADMAGWSNGKTLFWIAPPMRKAGRRPIARAISASTTMRSNWPAAKPWTHWAPFSKTTA